MALYRRAPAEVERIAESLIDKHHVHLKEFTVRFVMRDKAQRGGGVEKWGKARLVRGLNAFLATGNNEDVFVIELADDVWETLADNTKKALIDHELMHCTIDVDEEKGTITPTIRPHDVEEFIDIVRRYGAWRQEVGEFVKVGAEQLGLDVGAV